MCDSTVVGVRDFERMCSALAVCQTTRVISLRLSFSPTARQTSKLWWKWLAYSLFSVRAQTNSSVNSLTLILEEKMTSADMDAFCGIVASDHPEEELCGSSRGQMSDREATLEANARIKWQMTKQGNPRHASKDLIFPCSIPFVRTFSDDGTSEWVNVMIPGFSWCQVRRSCLKFADSEPGTSIVAAVTSLSTTFQNKAASNSSSLMRFLASVGTSLKYLTIFGPNLNLNENQILQNCPNLNTLRVGGKWFDAELDFSCYRGVREWVPSIKCCGLSVKFLADLLRDNDTVVTKCLRKLRIHERHAQDTVAALLKMLKSNESLEFLEIGGYSRMPDIEFRKLHLKPIKSARNLSKESKLAFLSVLSPQQPPASDQKRAYGAARTDGVLCDLDQFVLAKIFSYAGPPILRRTFFKLDRTAVNEDRYIGESSSEDGWGGNFVWFSSGSDWDSDDEWRNEYLETYAETDEE